MNVKEWLMNRTTVHDADEGQVLICCPFHGDNNPSMTVNLDRGVFHCFACKESGSFPKLIAEFDGITFEQAKEMVRSGEGDDAMLSSMLRMLEGEDEEKPVKPFSRKAFHKFFPPVLGTPGEPYLLGRGISRESAVRFDLRWGASGVMRDRVVFPIYDVAGKLITYGGRAVEQGVQPKTRKARSGLSGFYGLHELLSAYQIHDQVMPYLIIVEGEFDAMYLQQFQIPAISTMGTAALTEGQKVLLKRYCRMVVWSYDGDDAGRSAQVKGIKTTKGFMPTIGINLPDGKDPNELTVKQVKKIYGGF